MYYLWFIGVYPDEQNNGIGSSLLMDVIKQAEMMSRLIYLKTSTLEKIPWNEKLGFKIYNQLDLGYTLYFMKKGCSLSLENEQLS